MVFSRPLAFGSCWPLEFKRSSAAGKTTMWNRILNYKGPVWPLLLGAVVIFIGGISFRYYMDNRKGWAEEAVVTKRNNLMAEMDANLYSQSARFAEGISLEGPKQGDGYLRGKVMVIDVDHMNRSGALTELPEELWARTPAEVGTVVLHHCYFSTSQDYDCKKKSGGQVLGSAKVGVCRVGLVQWPEKTMIAVTSFEDPPQCYESAINTAPVSYYLKKLSRR